VLSVETVRKWGSRFTAAGTAGLADVPRPGRWRAGLLLTGAEREQLARWVAGQDVAGAGAEGRENKAVDSELRTTEHNVARWRGRFIQRPMDGLGDEKRPGRPPSVLLGLSTDPLFMEKVADVVGLYHTTRRRRPWCSA
jgi:transposase